jgi:hypothetical protein
MTAKQFLKEFLAPGPQRVRDIIKAAPVRYCMLNIVKKELGAYSIRIDGVWYWQLDK